MSKGAARLGDTAGGHGCFPPTPIISASPNVFTNGIPAARVSDPAAAHGCSSCSPHSRAIASGSSSVFINGLPAARLGDTISCGGVTISASGNVLIGDQFSSDRAMPLGDSSSLANSSSEMREADLKYRYLTQSGKEVPNVPFLTEQTGQKTKPLHIKDDRSFTDGQTNIVSRIFNEEIDLNTAWSKFNFKK